MNAQHKKSRDDRLVFGLGVLAMLATWETVVRLRWLSPASYAAPSEIVLATYQLFVHRGFLTDVVDTMFRALAGTIIGFPIGVLVALAIDALGRAQTAAERALDFVRSIPITTLIPIFIAIYGVGDRNKIAIGAFAALLATAVTVWIGLKHGSERYDTLIQLYKPSYRKRLLFILLPQSLPSLIAALRLSISSCLVLIIVGEMFIGTRTGIGKVINDMAYADDRPAQFAAVFCAGLLGYAMNAACEALRVFVFRRFGPTNQDGLA